MCGIVAYVGKRPCLPIILNGLKRLEYRGYDSAGVSIYQNGSLFTLKERGKICELEKKIGEPQLFTGTIGIGHTRWATHGEPNRVNAHPHTSFHNEITLVHNGIIENYNEIRTFLAQKGYGFKSDTDTEVLANFIEFFYLDSKILDKAVRETLSKVVGAFGLAIINNKKPTEIIGVKKGSPLLIGIGEDEYFLASDAAAVIDSTRNVVYLDEQQMAIINSNGYLVKTMKNSAVSPKIQEVSFDIEEIEKGGFEHFMLKEIFEQPKSIKETMRGRIIEDTGKAVLGGLTNIIDTLLSANRIIITACGTSWHASLIGEYLLEEFCRVPVEVEYASEFRYRDPILRKNDLIIVVSQSGETADTLAALREAKHKEATVIGICNVVGSSISRETDAGVYIHAGPEIGVASTKAFTSQVIVFFLMALMISRKKNMSSSQGIRYVKALRELPKQISSILEQAEHIRSIAKQFSKANNALYLGRGYNFPVALEGALKLKEISYIHAEGYPAAEIKHGPIALIDEDMPVLFLATDDAIFEKVLSNIEEVKARKGKIIAIATEGNKRVQELADHIINIPKTLVPLVPILSNIPLQLLSYYVAIERGCNVDQPRNLAKSVTVE